MDFHGSYKKAVTNLRDALRLHKKGFADALRKDQAWAAEDIEGPNIANVFKRTFYQMMLKFETWRKRCSGRNRACNSSGRLGQLAAVSWKTRT